MTDPRMQLLQALMGIDPQDGSQLPNPNGLTPEQIDALRRRFADQMPNNPQLNQSIGGGAQQMPRGQVPPGLDPNQLMQNY